MWKISKRNTSEKTVWRSDVYLQEVDEVEQNQPADLRQRLDHSDGCHRVITVTDALLVEVHGDEGLLQLTIPQFHQGGLKKKTNIVNTHI